MDKLRSEVATLESQVVSQEQCQPAPAAMQELGRLLQATVAQLEALGTVSPDAIAEAKSQSDVIFSMFKSTLDDATRAAAPPTRATSKTTPVPMQEAPVDHRVSSKQPPKRFIYYHFDPQAKRKSSNARRSFSVPPDASLSDL